jgi:hypothetical protein
MSLLVILSSVFNLELNDIVQVKPATVRGTKRCWAYVHSESEHPELSSKAWLVITNGEHAKQVINNSLPFPVAILECPS